MSEERSNWTKRYGEEHNRRRRERYHKDPAYREKVKARRRQLHERETADVPPGAVVRHVGGIEYHVYKIKEAAEHAGLSGPAIIRDMEKSGVIPQCSFPGQHRVYTQHQIGLIAWAHRQRKARVPLRTVRAFVDGKWNNGISQ